MTIFAEIWDGTSRSSSSFTFTGDAGKNLRPQVLSPTINKKAWRKNEARADSNHHFLLMKTLLTAVASLALSACTLQAQPPQAEWNTPGAGNPILPGYFADPTIRKFGDTFYIYATTDGTGNGYGPAQVWVSKDFVNWQNVLLNWPTTEVVWAPDVVQEPDGSYRYYYCTPCQVYVGESDSPLGPWTNRLGSPEAVLIPNYYVPNIITLDPMLFRDDDGSEYIYFGTWGIYDRSGCGVAKLSADGKSLTEQGLIPNTDAKDFFEAPFVFKKDGVYYFTYSSGSCHDDTYRVQYATSTVGPMGPFQYKGCILKTNADGTIHGPGHHSVFQDGDDYYIVYHRHNNPHSIHGFHRQLCIDRLQFDADGNILPVEASHEGVVPQSMLKNYKRYEGKNLAHGATVTASSSYSEWFKPEYAVDDNNGTLWKAASCHGSAWLQIDLGKAVAFNQVFTQFEYPTFFYQYKIETSQDGQQWTLYADKTSNRYAGSPMVDTGETTARYLRITISDTQHNGHFPAIWNVKVYQAKGKFNPLRALPNPRIDEEALLAGYPHIYEKDLEDDPAESAAPLFSLNASDHQAGEVVDGVAVVPKDGKLAFRFSGKGMTFDATPLHTLVYNAPYTVTAWVLNPKAEGTETLCQLMPTGADLATVQMRNGRGRNDGIVAHNASMENAGAPQALQEGKWQHWVLTFDGFMERIYCDGQEVSAKNIFLMLRPSQTFTVGMAADGSAPFSGYLHALKVYDRPFSPSDVAADMAEPSDFDPAMLAELAAKSPLRTESLSLQLDYHSKHLVEAQVVDSKGEVIEGGYEYLFAEGNDTTSAWSDVNKKLFGLTTETANAKRRKKTPTQFQAYVRDAFGYKVQVKDCKIIRDVPVEEDLSASINAKCDAKGTLTLESAGRQLNSDPSQNGPFEYVELDGDFIAQCHVAEMTGRESRVSPGFNEGGLLLADLQPDGTQNLIQLGVFPGYDCGNMLTTLISGMRPQYPNGLGWDFEPWLQLERRGNEVFVRTSKDGKDWHDLPQSPVSYQFRSNQPVRVGVFQTTYTAAKGAVTFDHISVTKTK